jgi:hypothetical protein
MWRPAGWHRVAEAAESATSPAEPTRAANPIPGGLVAGKGFAMSSSQRYLTARSIAKRRDQSLRSFDRLCAHPDPHLRFPPPDDAAEGVRRWKISTVRAYERKREQLTQEARAAAESAAAAGSRANPADSLNRWREQQRKRRPPQLIAME